MNKDHFLAQLKQDLQNSIPKAVKRIKLDEGDRLLYLSFGF